MKIDNNTVVSIQYTLNDEKGILLDSSEGKEPLVYIHGIGHLISGLETEMFGKVIGDKFSAIIEPMKAYGLYNDEAVHEVPLAGFEGDEALKVGMEVQLQGQDGTSIALVTKIEGDQVTIDLNHPMAGKTLYFDIEVLEVRAATSEEISHGHVHGAGGHQH